MCVPSSALKRLIKWRLDYEKDKIPYRERDGVTEQMSCDVGQAVERASYPLSLFRGFSSGVDTVE